MINYGYEFNHDLAKKSYILYKVLSEEVIDPCFIQYECMYQSERVIKVVFSGESEKKD